MVVKKKKIKSVKITREKYIQLKKKSIRDRYRSSRKRKTYFLRKIKKREKLIRYPSDKYVKLINQKNPLDRSVARKFHIFGINNHKNNTFCSYTDSSGRAIYPTKSTGGLGLRLNKGSMRRAMPEFLCSYIRRLNLLFRKNEKENLSALRKNKKKPKLERTPVVLKADNYNRQLLAFKLDVIKPLRKR